MWISQCEAPGRGPGLQRSSPLVRPVGRAPDVALRRAQGLATHTLTHPHTHVRLLAFLCLLLVVGCRPAPPPTLPAVNTDRYLIGAHYHVWYPSNFTHGYLRNALDPPQQPLLGHYRSSDPAVAEQHIAWCSRYGIDFLTLDWWPNRPEQNAAIQAGVMRAANLADIAFCIFYEAWDLNFDPATGATRFTDEVAARFVKHMHDLADTFFDHPAYLRVAGRPVVMLYLARTFAGDYARAVRQARRELAARGVEPFFIADEVFWGVIADRPSLRRNVMPAVGPQMRRIACFDAIFGYNLYDWSRPTHAGYGAESDFMYVSISGELGVVDPVSEDITARNGGTPELLLRLKAGELVGEMGFIRSVPRTATVTVLESGELLQINWKMIKRLQWLYPPTAQKFFFNLLTIICDRLEKTTSDYAASRFDT